VRFRCKDYRRPSAERTTTVTLTAVEFIRRFLVHVLPVGFHRMRYYGLLGNRIRRDTLAQCRHLLHMPAVPADEHARIDYRDRYEVLTGWSLRTCPVCGEHSMREIEGLPRHRLPIADTS
jgi:Putative transposase